MQIHHKLAILLLAFVAPFSTTTAAIIDHGTVVVPDTIIYATTVPGDADPILSNTHLFSLTGTMKVNINISQFNLSSLPFIANANLTSGATTLFFDSFILEPYNFSSTLAAGDYSLSINMQGQTGGFGYRLELATTPVPEPGTYILFISGLAGLYLLRRRKS